MLIKTPQTSVHMCNRGWFRGPIGAGEWGNSRSSYLTNHRCWTRVSYPGERGDVMGDGGHVAIVTGGRKTASATSTKVVKNDWGYRAGQSSRNMVVWRYTC